MRTLLMSSIFCLMTLGFAGQSIAEPPDATEVLKKMDAQMSGYDDTEMDVKMTVYDTDGSTKEYTFNIKQKGNDKRLIRFNSGEIKGMSMLTEDQNRVYVYLPGYKRVRRVAAHNMNQSLVGSELSNEDMATAAYHKVYTARYLKMDGEFHVLELTPKNPKDASYARLVVKVDPGNRMSSIDYYNDKGEKVKTFRAKKLKSFDGIKKKWHSLIEYADPRTGHRTTLHVESLKINQGLRKSLFTKRQLQWGR